MPRTSVLFAIPSLDRDGPDRVMFELLCALDRNRFVPSLLVSEPTGHYLSRLPDDVKVTVLGPQRKFTDRYPLLRALRVVRSLAPDVVFSTLRMNLTMGLIAKGFPRKTRLVIRQANDFTTDFAQLMATSTWKHQLARRLVITALRQANSIVCQSEHMRDDLRAELGDGAPPMHAIGNPINVDVVTRASLAATVSLPGQPSLVSVGRLARQKGMDILLPAIAAVRSEYPGMHLTILGDGPDRIALEQQSQKLGLSDAVTFAGYSSHVLPTVRAASLFVLASRYEGFPNAALEALACGTPVVLTDCPGANRTLVLPGKNGELAAAVEVSAMAEALRRALTWNDRADSAAITADIEQRFAARHIAAAYEQVLESR